MPTVVPVVTDASGARADVEVKMDGQTIAPHLDGHGLPVEPGLHEFVFTTSDGLLAREKVMVPDGANNREIDVYIGGARPAQPKGLAEQSPAETSAAPAPADGAPKAPQPTQPDNAEHEKPAVDRASTSTPPGAPAPVAVTDSNWAMPRSPAPYIAGGLGLLGVSAGVLFTAVSNQDKNAQAVCSPSCPYFAELAFGAGAVSLLASTFMFATSHKTPEQKATAASPVSLAIAPSPSGAVAALRGSFR